MNTLSQSTALLSGSDLWVLPQYEESSWTGKIDWILNFIILKNIRHQRSKILPQMREFIQETQFPASEIKSDSYNSNMLLVVSEKLVPNRWVIHCPMLADSGDKNEAKLWIKQILSAAKSLHAPSVRVFIPKSIPSVELMPLFDQELKLLKYPVEMTFVQDGTST
jgi:hypothetical protein